MTVQGPVKKQQPDGMSHRGAGNSTGFVRGWMSGSEAKKKTVRLPKVDLQVRAPLIDFILFLKQKFLM